MENCLFCKIIKKEIPATIVYEDEHCIAFLDINPVNKGHTLVVPKEHSTNLFDISEQSLQHVMAAVQKLMHAVKKAIQADGITIGVNNEKGAGQVVFHTHIHIMPRFSGDGHELWHGKPYPNQDMKEMIGRHIREAF